jgi:hypothetical protein
MQASFEEDDVAAALVERQWFAVDRAAGRLRDECEALGEVMRLAEAARRDARCRLEQIEALRNALGQELAHRDARSFVSASSHER